MGQKWKDYGEAAEHGPAKLAAKVIPPVVILVIILAVMGYALGWFGEAAKVAQKEFGPEALLEKYEWFKDASAQLDKKLADIKVYDGRLVLLKEAYGDALRKDWAREDREQFNLWSNEVAGVKASYNGLAAEYNAQMVKFNWRFANKGMLPKGAEEPLPREYKPYVTN